MHTFYLQRSYESNEIIEYLFRVDNDEVQIVMILNGNLIKEEMVYCLPIEGTDDFEMFPVNNGAIIHIKDARRLWRLLYSLEYRNELPCTK